MKYCILGMLLEISYEQFKITLARTASINLFLINNNYWFILKKNGVVF